MTRLTAQDVRAMPMYTAADAAHFLRLPLSTSRAWAFGHRDGDRWRFEPVIAVADRKARKLSFINLVELSVLAAIRRRHSVPLPKVRKSMNYLRKQFPTAHPLADHEFQTDGVGLFVEKFGQLLNISQDGQIEMRQMIEAHLKSIARDGKGIPIKLPLPLRDPLTQQPSQVVIDPTRGFGRPVVDQLSVRTEILVGRFRAGEAIASIAKDYDVAHEVVEDVLRLAA